MMSYIVKSAWHLLVHLVGAGDVDLVVRVLAGQTSFTTTLDPSLPTSGDKLFCRAMVERRDRLSWLCNDDDVDVDNYDKDDDGDVRR